MVLGAILRQPITTLGRYIYTTLRQQDRIIDYTYRKTGLYNRGVVRGIKHGLAGGQIAGGIASLGLSAEDSPGNYATPFQKRPKSQTNKSYKTRNRRTRRFCDRYDNIRDTRKYS